MASDLLQSRREQVFPKLTPARLARLEPHCARRETAPGEVLLDVGEGPHGLLPCNSCIARCATSALPPARAIAAA